MFAQPRRDDDELVRIRIDALVRWGFAERRTDARGERIMLTEKGWRTLSAAAEPGPAPAKQSKSVIEAELRQWANDIVRVTAWRDAIKGKAK